jgi:pSer/pThr/pTyr-binding forkhead associated (FHA) protein
MANGPALTAGTQHFPLNKVTSSIGRRDRITNLVPDVDLGSLDTDRSVSRRHAEVSYDKGLLSLRDVGSTNGTTVNGQRLAHQVDQLLKDGDEVAFGSVSMVFTREAEWPEGVEAEWPPDLPEPLAEETMVSAPTGSEETMMSPPGPAFDGGETMVYSPDAPPPMPGEAAPEPPPPPPPPAPEPVYAPEPVEAHVACTNHPHMTAVGLCPGCLEPFCVDCLPEREDGLMVCNRCAGISYRLAAVVG